jgi:hypothetical protein
MKKLLLLFTFFFFAILVIRFFIWTSSSDEKKQIIIVDGKNYNSEYVTKEDSRVADIWESGTTFVLNNTSTNLILESVIYKPKLSVSNLAVDAAKLINKSFGNDMTIDGQLLDASSLKEAKRSYFLNDEIKITPGVNAINVYLDYLFTAPPKVKLVDEEEVNWYLHR